MTDAKTTQLLAGTWDKLPTEDIERHPKVVFDLNKTIEVEFIEDAPREYSGDTGAYYVFNVIENNEQKVIMTSAWSMLRALKTLSPLKNIKARITKRMVKGKQQFEVVKI